MVAKDCFLVAFDKRNRTFFLLAGSEDESGSSFF